MEAQRAAQESQASQAGPASRSGSLAPVGRGGEGRGDGPRPATAAAPPPARKPGKLSFKEQREYEGIEAAIQAAEEKKGALEATLGDPATYARGGAAVAGLRAELEAATAEVERLYARWEALEAIKAGG